MAKMVKGARRYILVRGKNEGGGDIVIDMFSKKELDGAMGDGRVQEEDHVWKIEVKGKADLKKPRKRKRGSKA